MSGARESWEYDSGARDLQSPEPQTHPTIQKLLERGGVNLDQQVVLQKLVAQASSLSYPMSGGYLDLANTVSAAVPMYILLLPSIKWLK